MFALNNRSLLIGLSHPSMNGSHTHLHLGCAGNCSVSSSNSYTDPILSLQYSHVTAEYLNPCQYFFIFLPDIFLYSISLLTDPILYALLNSVCAISSALLLLTSSIFSIAARTFALFAFPFKKRSPSSDRILSIF